MSDTKTFDALTAVVRPVGDAPPTPKRKKKPRPWCRAVFTDLASAEELLDQLEGSGHAERRLTITGDTFVVRWKPNRHPTRSAPLALVWTVAVLCLVAVLAVAGFHI